MSDSPQGLEDRRRSDGKFGSGRSPADFEAARERALHVLTDDDSELNCSHGDYKTFEESGHIEAIEKLTADFEQTRLKVMGTPGWRSDDPELRARYDTAFAAFNDQAADIADHLRTMCDEYGIDVDAQTAEAVRQATGIYERDLRIRLAAADGLSGAARAERRRLQTELTAVPDKVASNVNDIGEMIPDVRLHRALWSVPREPRKHLFGLSKRP